MSAFLNLLKVSVNNQFGLSAMKVKYIRDKTKLWEPVLIGFALIAAAISFGGMFYIMAEGLVAAAPPGQSDFVLTLSILATQLLALVLGLFTMISVFYFSTDLDILVPLPLKEWTILAAKFGVANITEYLPTLLLFVPPLFAYNHYVPLGLGGWIASIVVFILLPITPLAIAGILAVTVMRGLNRRHRDILVIVASLLLLVAILYFQYVFQSALMNQVDMEAVLQNRVDFVRLIGGIFPPSIWATRAISRAGELEGLLSLVYLLVATVASVAAFLAVGQKVFYGGLVGGAEKVRKGVEYNSKVISREAVQTPVLRTLLIREIRLFTRVPIWVMNGFITVVLIPVMALFPALTGGQGLDQVADIINASPTGTMLSAIIVAAVIVFMTSLNTLASTSVSREGKHLWISKTLPVPPREQVKAKLLFALLAAVISGLPLVAMYAIVLKPGAIYVVSAYILGIVAGFAPQALGLMYDMWRPFLTWTNPQHAVKNNLNALSSGLIMLPIGLVSYLLFKYLAGPLGTGVFILLAILNLVLAVASVIATLKFSDLLYGQLEIKG